MRIVCFHSLLFIFFLFGCATLKYPIRIIDSDIRNPLLTSFNGVIDFISIKPGDIDAATASTFQDADKILDDVLAIINTARTFENTLLKIDDLYNTIYKVWNLIDLLSSTHPSKAIRNEADENDLKIQAYMIALSINEELYKAIQKYSNSKEAQELTKSRERFLQSELNDFKRSGIELNIRDRLELKEIQTNLSELSILFSNNITSSVDTIFISEELTGGLPEDYKVARFQTEGNYAIDLSYPSYDSFMKYHKRNPNLQTP